MFVTFLVFLDIFLVLYKLNIFKTRAMVTLIAVGFFLNFCRRFCFSRCNLSKIICLKHVFE